MAIFYGYKHCSLHSRMRNREGKARVLVEQVCSEKEHMVFEEGFKMGDIRDNISSDV